MLLTRLEQYSKEGVFAGTYAGPGWAGGLRAQFGEALRERGVSTVRNDSSHVSRQQQVGSRWSDEGDRGAGGVVDALDARAAHFYEAHGFTRLVDAKRLILPMQTMTNLIERE